MADIVGRVMTVEGSQITVDPEADHSRDYSFPIGAMVKVCGADREVVAAISVVRSEQGSHPKRMLVADLLGEIARSNDETLRFRRGVTRHPFRVRPLSSQPTPT